jgi:hypothetical protein
LEELVVQIVVPGDVEQQIELFAIGKEAKAFGKKDVLTMISGVCFAKPWYNYEYFVVSDVAAPVTPGITPGISLCVAG